MNECPNRVAFLTGQSDPKGNALTAGQWEFLDRSGIPVEEIFDRNFPYRPCEGDARKVPLWRASVNNGLQFLRSRGEAFAAGHREEVMQAFAGCGRVVLLAGSCGLELLANLRLPDEFLARTHVFAYGPVSRSLPQCATLWRVQGDRDYISKWWHRRVDHEISCHHMNYLETPETMELFRRFYQSVTGRKHVQA